VQAFEKCQETLIGEVEYFLRDRHNLDDFLFELNTDHSDKEAMKVRGSLLTARCLTT